MTARRNRLAALALLACGCLNATPASGQTILPGVTLTPAPGNSSALQILLLMTVLTALPAIFMSVTPFLRIIIVMHFLRQALGTQTAPSNQVLVGISLFLTLLLIQPVASDVYEHAWKPYEQGTLSPEAAWDTGSQPVKAYLLRFAREKDLQLFAELAKTGPVSDRTKLGLLVIVPAYILSELKAGFQIGAVLFLPFLVIDLVVAAVTLSVGMVQLPPVMISAPFKILLFVLIDGWNLLIGSLVRSFYS